MIRTKWKRYVSLLMSLLILLTPINGLIHAEEAQSSRFTDLKGHWAETTIQEWTDNGFTKGYSDGTFKPSSNVTRAEFVSLLNRAFKPAVDVNNFTNNYSDVSQTDWFYTDVMIATKVGAISGYSTEKFGPHDYITRQDASVIISRYFNLNEVVPASTLDQFIDAAMIKDYAKDGVASLAEFGIVKGNAEGAFEPGRSLTRAESIVMLNNVYVLIHGDTGISGKVYYDHKPLPNATISITKTDDYKIVSELKSDSTGSYVSKLEVGSYNITASYEGKISYKSEVVVRDNFKTFIKLAAQEGQKVLGKVLDANGKPLANTVLIFRTNPYFTVTTNASGQFETVLPAKSVYEVYYEKDNKPIHITKFTTTTANQSLDLGLIKLNGEETTPSTVSTGGTGGTGGGSGSSGGSGTGGGSTETTPKVPQLSLLDDNGVLEFKIENTESINTYTFTRKLNNAVSDQIVSINVTSNFVVDKPSFAGIYSYSLTAKGSSGKTSESNSVNYIVTSTGESGEIGVDSDHDGLDDATEKELLTDPKQADTDGDGLPDGYEYLILGTSPIHKDTDNNGISDANEDLDQDGLSNSQEFILGTNPTIADTDKDSLTDSEEVNIYNTNPLLSDTDGDTLSDGDEIVLGTNPLQRDSDNNGISDADEKIQQTVKSDNFQAALLVNNDATPSLQVTSEGNVNSSILLIENTGAEFGETRSIVGKPVKISGADFDSAVLSFTLPATEALSRSMSTDQAINTKLISRFNEESETTYYDTNFDPSTGTLTANIEGPGTYFVTDVKEMFNELGLTLPSELTGTPVPETTMFSSKARTQPLTAEQSNSMQNEKATDDTLSSLSEPEANVTSSVYSEDQSIVQLLNSRKITTEAGAAGQADIVFIIDTTGSMAEEIDNVRNNVSAFVDALKIRNIAPYLGLVEYKDINADGIDSTIVYKNGTKNWFSDIELYKSKIKTLNADGGGDTPESAVDALETARLLDMRSSAAKFFILVTDADYHVDNRYGIESMASEIELLNNQKINTSVVTSQYIKSVYNDLYSQTGGIYANINGDFYHELLAIADKIGDVVEEDGVWIYLDGPTPTPVKVKVLPENADETVDSDSDGVPDIHELESIYPTREIDLDAIVSMLMPKLASTTSSKYGVAKVYKYYSNPSIVDTDKDGYGDSSDLKPKVPYQTPVLLLHGRIDNTANTFGVQTLMYKEGDNLNDHYGSDFSLKDKLQYGKFSSHLITKIVTNSNKEKTPENLGFELESQGYLSNLNMFAFNYPNEDLVNINAGRLDSFIDDLAAYMGTSKDGGYFYPTKEDRDAKKININLIGHSMGGLVSRYYMENLYGSRNINKLITIDTPHWGSGFADVAMNFMPQFVPADADLSPSGRIYGGSGMSEKLSDYVYKKQKYAATNQTDRLKVENAAAEKYYFIAGYDVEDPNNRLPKELRNQTMSLDLNLVSGDFQAFTDSIESGFHNKYGYEDTITFDLLTMQDGDNVVNNQSQFGIKYSKRGERIELVPSVKQALMIDTFPWHNLMSSLHSQTPHRKETIDKVIEYLAL